MVKWMSTHNVAQVDVVHLCMNDLSLFCDNKTHPAKHLLLRSCSLTLQFTTREKQTVVLASKQLQNKQEKCFLIFSKKVALLKNQTIFFLISLPAQPAVQHKSTLFILNVTKMLPLSNKEFLLFSYCGMALLLWVDSFKPWNDVGNLTLLSNVRFSILRTQ